MLHSENQTYVTCLQVEATLDAVVSGLFQHLKTFDIKQKSIHAFVVAD